MDILCFYYRYSYQISINYITYIYNETLKKKIKIYYDIVFYFVKGNF